MFVHLVLVGNVGTIGRREYAFQLEQWPYIKAPRAYVVFSASEFGKESIFAVHIISNADGDEDKI